MFKRNLGILIAASLCAGVSLAQGPGSQIRGGQDTPKGPRPNADAKQCEPLRDEAKARCLKEAREKADAAPRSGPESTGMGSGAGASGATGHGSPGSSAPR